MSAIRLNGTTSGYTEIAPPATAGDNTITLPSSNGSANQFLKNGSTAGTLGWSSMVEDSSGNINIDSGTFYVDAGNNRVGIGTTSPSVPLEVNGSIYSKLSTSGEAAIAAVNSIASFFVLQQSDKAHFYTGASQPIAFTTSNTERARITSSGALLIGQNSADFPASANISGASIGSSGTANFSRDAETALELNRKTNDGNLALFRQDGTIEGSITVSGTTVSYNGAHLSRWSQIPGIDPHDKDARPEILRGTVMSNLDEMCDWIDPDSGEAQANEQLNKTKISDVEGDKNVAGVFQSWDDDDDTWVNDFYLAMTGDFVIRIAEGVTVERGDLLISAGDGTAKPQDDDLIRSSTVAKVTSTTVSHVHPDGSYCIPCVLMAC